MARKMYKTAASVPRGLSPLFDERDQEMVDCHHDCGVGGGEVEVMIVVPRLGQIMYRSFTYRLQIIYRSSTDHSNLII